MTLSSSLTATMGKHTAESCWGSTAQTAGRVCETASSAQPSGQPIAQLFAEGSLSLLCASLGVKAALQCVVPGLASLLSWSVMGCHALMLTLAAALQGWAVPLPPVRCWPLLLSWSVMGCHAWMLTHGAALQVWQRAPLCPAGLCCSASQSRAAMLGPWVLPLLLPCSIEAVLPLCPAGLCCLAGQSHAAKQRGSGVDWCNRLAGLKQCPDPLSPLAAAAKLDDHAPCRSSTSDTCHRHAGLEQCPPPFSLWPTNASTSGKPSFPPAVRTPAALESFGSVQSTSLLQCRHTVMQQAANSVASGGKTLDIRGLCCCSGFLKHVGAGANCAFMLAPQGTKLEPLMTGWLADPSVLQPGSTGVKFGSQVGMAACRCQSLLPTIWYHCVATDCLATCHTHHCGAFKRMAACQLRRCVASDCLIASNICLGQQQHGTSKLIMFCRPGLKQNAARYRTLAQAGKYFDVDQLPCAMSCKCVTMNAAQAGLPCCRWASVKALSCRGPLLPSCQPC